MLMQNRIDMGHARALLGLSGAKQVAAAEQIAQKKLSVREAEELVKRANSQPKPEKLVDTDVARLEQDISEILGAAVSIQQGKKGAGCDENSLYESRAAGRYPGLTEESKTSVKLDLKVVSNENSGLC